MSTTVYVANNLQDDLSASTSISPALSSSDWSHPSGPTSLPTGGGKTQLYWINRNEGIKDGHTWVVTSTVTVGGSAVQLEVQLVGTFASSDISVQIIAGADSTGWSSSDTQTQFTAVDGNTYGVTASFVSGDVYDNVVFAASLLQDAVLPNIDHVVVLMMENRSLDNLLGWIYPSGSAPAQVLPAGSSSSYNGLQSGFSNSDPGVNEGQPVYVSDGTSQWTDSNHKTIAEWCVPSPDPGEEFDHVATQISDGMSGFLTDYLTQESGTPAEQIMQSYSVAQLPIISTLATSFAVSDAWHASVPSQTWPNRGFMQTGSSDGHVNNDDYAAYHNKTVFDVFGANNLSWMVYNDGLLASLTKTMFRDQYWHNETNFKGIDEFTAACAGTGDQRLPAFSFVEPDFGALPDSVDESYHPPADVRPGEQFLRKIYTAIQESPYRDNILFIVMFDEHGGTYDHVEPPTGVAGTSPGAKASNGFTFDQLGVRIPAIVVSSFVTPGTVFRSNTSVPLDHTSVLATLRDWQGLSTAFASTLPSPRIGAAPNLGYVLTETSAQSWPTLPPAPADLEAIHEQDDSEPLNAVQQSVLIGTADIIARREARASNRAFTGIDAKAARARLQTRGDARVFMDPLQRYLPVR